MSADGVGRRLPGKELPGATVALLEPLVGTAVGECDGCDGCDASGGSVSFTVRSDASATVTAVRNSTLTAMTRHSFTGFI